MPNEQRLHAATAALAAVHLTASSAGWYWQTDPRLRLVHVFGNPAGGAAIGRLLWEVPGLDTSHPDWTHYFDALMTRRPFENLVWRRHEPSGRLRDCLVSGEPMFGPKGRFRGFRGIGHETGEAVAAVRALVRGIDDAVATLVAHAAQAREQLAPASSVRQVLERIEQAGQRARSLCRIDDATLQPS